MLFLKQSTAVVVSFGPAVLNSDGVTYVTNLAGTGSNQTENTSTGIRISKNGGALAARHATATASSYDAFGHYLVTLDTTDVGTLGTLRMTYGNAAAFCPLFQDFMVVPAPMYNSLFGTGGSIPDAAAGAAGGLPVSAAGSLDLDEMNVDIEAIQVSTAGLTYTIANQVDVNVLDWKSATAPAMTGDAFARLGAPAGASVSADVAAIKAETAEIDAIVDLLPDAGALSSLATATNLAEANADLDELITTIGASGAGLTAVALTSAYDFAKGTVAMTESYAANGVAPTPVQATFAIHQMLMDFAIATTSYTVKKLDNSATAFVVTLDSATAPTAAART